MNRNTFVPAILTLIMLLISGCGGSGPAFPLLRDDEIGPAPGEVSEEIILGLANNISGLDLLGKDVRNLPQYLEDEVLIVLHAGVNPTLLYPLAKSLGLSLIEEIELMWGTVYRMRIDTGESVESMVGRLNLYPEIHYAEPNVLLFPCAAPYFPNDKLFEFDGDADDDPFSNQLDQWGPNVLGASLVWPTTKGSEDVIVAVTDMGIRFTHEELANQYWINEDEIPDNGIDDDDNGFIDDWRGWDFCDQDNEPWDDWHGTPCAGVVAAEQDNGVGGSGIAPGCKVMAVRLDASVQGTTVSSLMAGIQYAYDNGAAIVSMSLRSYIEHQILHETFIAVYDDGNGMLPVGGSGNENSSDLSYPACWPEVVDVGGTCSFYDNGARRDVRRIVPADYGWGSNWGESLEVMGPGYWIVTPHAAADDFYWDGVNFKACGGVSMATPACAASYALLKSYYPQMTAGELRERLRDTCDDIDVPGHDDQTGWGRVNVWRAIFGSDPNEDQYDENGHIPLEPDGSWFYDNIFDIQASADYDIEDVYVLAADIDGVLEIDLDIITTGEDFDMVLFSDPDLQNPVIISSGPNGETNPLEDIALEVTAGQVFYLQVISAGPSNCSNYRLRADIEPYAWWVEHTSLAPIFFPGIAGSIPLLKLEIHSNRLATVDTMRAYLTGDMPVGLINYLWLYEDTNNSGYWEGWIDEVVGSVTPSFVGINQAVFPGIGGYSNHGEPLRYFLVANVGVNDLGHNINIGVGLRTYKDITILEDLPLEDDPFPIFSDLTVVGEDNEPPIWDDTTGIQHTKPLWKSLKLYWNKATDELNGPTKYNLYWDAEYPPQIKPDQVLADIPFSPYQEYDCYVTVGTSVNGQTYFFCIRAEDDVGNEDVNEVWLDATPGDTSYPDDPQIIGEIALPGYCYEVAAHDNIAYVANSDLGVAIIDCSNPEEPFLVDSYQLYQCYSLAYDDGPGYIYAACDYGLVIIDPDAPGGPELIGTYGLLPYGIEVAVDGDICFLAGYGYLHAVSISDPSEPEFLGELYLGPSIPVYGLTARDGYAYACTHPKGLKIIDATDPTAPYVVKTVSLQSYLYEIDLWGDYALVTNFKSRLFFVVDISDPPNTFKVGDLNLVDYLVYGVVARDDQYAYVVRNPDAIWSVKWDDFGDIHVVGSVAISSPSELAYDGEYLYVTAGPYGLKVIL